MNAREETSEQLIDAYITVFMAFANSQDKSFQFFIIGKENFFFCWYECDKQVSKEITEIYSTK